MGGFDVRSSALFVLVVLALGVLVGCGSDDGEESTSTEAATTNGGSSKKGKAESASGTGAAKPEESIQDAQKRIEDAVGSGDCEEIDALAPLTRQETPDDARCEATQDRLDGAELLGSEGYDGGGVIDYQTDQGPLTAVLVVDQDGLYHLAHLDPIVDVETAKTKPAKSFDGAAEGMVEALAEGDCDAFQEAAGGDVGDDVCDFVSENVLTRAAEGGVELKPKNLGANEHFAFYGIETPASHYTLVVARRTEDGSDDEQFEMVDLLGTNSKAGG